MKHKHFVLITALTTMSLAFSMPAPAQRGHGGGPPAGHGPSGAANSSGPNSNATGRTDMSHASPSTALSHNTAIAKKIAALTHEDAATACDGFKNLGQCVAAAHVANNLKITGGFLALKAKVTGTGAMSLGKAIQSFAPTANAKSEVKKANKQASDDMKETETSS